jgi:hypothetical protein
MSWFEVAYRDIFQHEKYGTHESGIKYWKVRAKSAEAAAKKLMDLEWKFMGFRGQPRRVVGVKKINT